MVVLVLEEYFLQEPSIAAAKTQKPTLIRNKLGSKFSDVKLKLGPKEATSCLFEICKFYAASQNHHYL